jgi:hypothetical protein
MLIGLFVRSFSFSGPDWTAVSIKIMPTNTPAHRANRVKFATEHLKSTFGGPSSKVLWIDIDEKNFVAFQSKVCYVPVELAHTVTTHNANSKKVRDLMGLDWIGLDWISFHLID